MRVEAALALHLARGHQRQGAVHLPGLLARGEDGPLGALEHPLLEERQRRLQAPLRPLLQHLINSLGHLVGEIRKVRQKIENWGWKLLQASYQCITTFDHRDYISAQ